MSRPMLGAFNPPAGVGCALEVLYVTSDAPQPPLDALAAIHRRGRTPILTVQPYAGLGNVLDWLPNLGDAPLSLRYGHEFNGTWYPWSRNPDDYVKSFRQIAEAKPKNVRMLWCPNVEYAGSKPLMDFWPGEQYIDILGIDGYNRAGQPPNPDASFATIFRGTLDQLHALAPDKPIVVCETASPRTMRAPTATGVAGHPLTVWERAGGVTPQTDWIRDMWQFLRTRPEVTGVCWFNQDKPDGTWALSASGLRAFFNQRGR